MVDRIEIANGWHFRRISPDRPWFQLRMPSGNTPPVPWTEEDAYAFVAAQLAHAQAAQAAAEQENTRLRAALAQSDQPCVYCTLPREDWAKCQSGFPGCDRADDAMGCPELGARMEVEQLRDALAHAQAAQAAAVARIAVLEEALRPFAHLSLVSNPIRTEYVVSARAALSSAGAGDGAERVRHVKSGHVCTVLYRSARLQAGGPLSDMQPMVVYEHGGNIWCRPQSEFDDGRFEPALPAQEPPR